MRKVIQRSKRFRGSSYDDDDANELPVVAGWSSRARVEHYSGIWYSPFSHSIFPPFRLSLSLSRSLSPSYPLEALHLPCPKLFTFYFIIFFFLPMLSLFFRTVHGEHRGRRPG